jgi:hypothetical protein
MVGDIEAVVEALNRAQVRYLVVGGVAVVLHGFLRTTADLDLVIQLEAGNANRAMRALDDLGYRPRAPVSPATFADAATRESWVRDKGLTVFSLWSPQRPSLEVDLFVQEPFDFDAVYSRAVRVKLDRSDIVVIGLEDLIALKRASGRPVDQEDIERLEAIRNRGGVPSEPPGDDDADA